VLKLQKNRHKDEDETSTKRKCVVEGSVAPSGEHVIADHDVVEPRLLTTRFDSLYIGSGERAKDVWCVFNPVVSHRDCHISASEKHLG